MKRIIAFLLILSSIILMASCSKTKEFNYDIQVCGYSDSVSEADYTLEFSRWYEAPSEKKSLKGKTFEWEKSGISLKGTYATSETRQPEYYLTHSYMGEDGYRFQVDEKGNLVFFYRSKKSLNSTEVSLSESQCLEIACDFFSQMIEHAEDYTITKKYNDTFEEYDVIFTKYIASWATADEAVISVDPTTGEITSYRATMIEQMDVNATVDLDKDKLNAVVTEKLDRIFKKAKEKYDEVNYGEYSYVLTLNSEKEYAVVCTVEVECVTALGGGQSLAMGELMSFVIT